MRVLLDTGIVAHGELSAFEYCKVKRLYRWIDLMGAQRVIHPLTARRIPGFGREYHVARPGRHSAHPLERYAPHLSALLSGEAETFVTEDTLSRAAAAQFGLEERVMNIESFVRMAAGSMYGANFSGEVPISEEFFRDIDVSVPFFDSLRGDYPGFERWFEAKALSTAYVSRDYDGEMLGFLYIKPEDEGERYDDITPALRGAKRLKLGTFKVACAGLGLGSRFMRIALERAEKCGAEQVYATLFSGRYELDTLAAFLHKNGFRRFGTKKSPYGRETVMLRQMPG